MGTAEAHTYRSLVENEKERDHLGDLHVNGIVKEHNGKAWAQDRDAWWAVVKTLFII
jgi:hypothetical protein